MSTFANWTSKILIICTAIIWLGGCSKSFTAREYPSFYEPNMRTVAVLPFQNETNIRGTGMLAAEHLAAALSANGTYRIIPPRRLQLLLAKAKLPNLSATDTAQNMETLRQLGGVQAFITGRVLRDSEMTSPYSPGLYSPLEYVPTGRVHTELVEADDDEGDDSEGGFGGDFGDDWDYYPPNWYSGGFPYYYYPEYNTFARVSLEASMIQVSDGAVLFTTPVPVQGSADLASSRRILPTSATLDAMHQAMVKLVKELAVVPVEVKVNPQSDLRTATGQEDGRWTFRNKFNRDQEKVYVVVNLPQTVGHDSFRLTVAPKGRPDQAVVTKDFHWPANRHTDAIPISPQAIAERSGAGTYTVHLYAMGEPVMRHSFTIK